MLEIEIRCAITADVEMRLSKKLEQMRLLEEKPRGVDSYYDTADLALLQHRRAVFVRVRDGHRLQFKFDEDREVQAACIEREFVLAEDGMLSPQAHALFQRFLPAWQVADTWEEARTRNRLIELVRIDKARSMYTDGALLVSIDQVKDLGRFVEIEMNCKEGEETDTARATVHAFAAEIGGRGIRAGYFEMWLYRHQRAAYQQVPAQFRVQEGDLSFAPIEQDE